MISSTQWNGTYLNILEGIRDNIPQDKAVKFQISLFNL